MVDILAYYFDCYCLFRLGESGESVSLSSSRLSGVVGGEEVVLEKQQSSAAGPSNHVMNTRSIQRALQGHSGPRVESLSSRGKRPIQNCSRVLLFDISFS